MLSQLEKYYAEKEEPLQSAFLSLRKIILDFDEEIKESWKYQVPFFTYKNKLFCYFYKKKNTKLPYIGFAKGGLMSHTSLEQGDRKKMKVYHFDPNEDIHLQEVLELLKEAKSFY